MQSQFSGQITKSSGLSALALRGPDSSQGLIRPQNFAVDSKKSVLVPVLASYQPGNPNTSHNFASSKNLAFQPRLPQLSKAHEAAISMALRQRGQKSLALFMRSPPYCPSSGHGVDSVNQPGHQRRNDEFFWKKFRFIVKWAPISAMSPIYAYFKTSLDTLQMGQKCEVSSARIKRLPN